jgi:cell division protein FtsI/penicillin-binding protein 2
VKRPGDGLWTEADLGTNAFGQGLAVTPLQELVAISAIANGGVMLQPHLVAEIRDGDQTRQFQPTVLGRPISERTADTVVEMMMQAVAREVAGAAVPGYTIAGKTGTAQIAEGGVYHPSDVIGTFVGFLPPEDPQVIVLVKIDRPQIAMHERWGSMTAAPVFSELMQHLVVLLDIPPDGERAMDRVAAVGQ